ncbi:MAG: amidohydrolase [Sphingomonadales bacterium]|nr:amidohydrolase [Sphingomonadales bacterium]
MTPKFILAVALPMLLAQPAMAQVAAPDIDTAIARDMPSLMELYRTLHANPELSGQETASAARLAAEARKLGFVVTERVGGTGVVAVMENGPGPVLLIRADMDALPVTEATGLPFASRVRVTTDAGVETGVMHACGHDTHMTAWVAAARQLAARKAEWSGTLVMIGQPAEETGAGAQAMLDDGLFTRFPKPTHAIAFHDAAQFPAGMVGYTPGYALANVDSVDITVKGVGGHGAYPHTTKDPIVLASKIVMALQTLVSREVDPQAPAVVTVGSFHAGAKHNVISDEARLQLTVRSYTDEVREQLLSGIARVTKGEAIAAGIDEARMPVVRVLRDDYTPSTYNVPAMAERFAAVATARFGAERVIKAPPVMGGEDFGRYYRADKSIESLIFWAGGVDPADFAAAQRGEKTLPSLHSATWAPKADLLIATAAEAMTAMALDILKK